MKVKTLALIVTCIIASIISPTQAATKRVYMSYILHGNMNYDRYIRPYIWQQFPIIYNNLLDFMDEHPDFKGKVQFSGHILFTPTNSASGH